MVDGREDGPADVSKATEDYPGINLSLSPLQEARAQVFRQHPKKLKFN